MTQSLMKVQKVLKADVPQLGARIKEVREADERSLTQICAAIKMTTANWYKIEAEETKILPLKTLRKIEKVLGVDFGVSFEEADND